MFDTLKRFVETRVTQPVSNWFYRQGARFGLNAGMTEEETRQQFEEIGLGVTAPFFSGIWQRVQDTADRFGYITRLNPQDTPIGSNFEPANWISDKYGYVVEYDVFDTQGNLVGRKTSRFDIDKELSQEEILGLATEIGITDSGGRLVINNNFRIKGALTNPNINT